MILRDKLARLLHKQWRGKIETWEEISEHRQEQFLEMADAVLELVVDSIQSLEFKV